MSFTTRTSLTQLYRTTRAMCVFARDVQQHFVVSFQKYLTKFISCCNYFVVLSMDFQDVSSNEINNSYIKILA
jgi:hypothetical protein